MKTLELKSWSKLTLVVVFLSLSTISCTDSFDEREDLSLEKQLVEIEKTLILDELQVKDQQTTFDENNSIYFSNLSKVKRIVNEKEKTKRIKEIKSNYYKNIYNNSYNKEKIKKLPADVELIFKSYFKLTVNRESSDLIKITNYYINQISKLNISEDNLAFCLNALSFNKYLIGYTNDDSNIEERYKLKSFDSCYDSCMRRKASAVFDDGNWVDKAQFLLTAAETVAWWAGSCIWKCS